MNGFRKSRIVNFKGTMSINLHSTELDILLKSLELFSYNMNHIWIFDRADDNYYQVRDVLFYMYHRILNLYTETFEDNYISENIDIEIKNSFSDRQRVYQKLRKKIL